MNEMEEIERRRAELKSEFGSFYDTVLAILFEADPIEINFGNNTDEYGPEVDTILPRLRECHSVDDLQKVIHEEFVRWFDAETAGPLDRYQPIAQRIWPEVERLGLSGVLPNRS